MKGKINKKKDFDNIFKKGKSAKGSFLILRYIKNDKNIDRTAFLVSKKVSSKAVIRNKIRRRIQESVKISLKDKVMEMDFVFVALPKTKDKNFAEVKEEVLNLVKKATT